MSSFKEKAQVFIIGLTIGLLVAGAFFILKLDDYIRELSFYKNVSKTFSSGDTKSAGIVDKTDDTADQPKAKTKKIKAEEAASEEGTTRNTAEPDTLKTSVKNDTTNNAFVAADDIVVRKDELLSTKTVDVQTVGAIAKATAKDSLLQKVSGIKDDKNSDKQMFNVEFWSSPLNYKGYKMSRYKMVLYGISSSEGLKVYKLDDVVYLKYQSAVYRLDYASDFKPYERITDENITGKLK